MQGASSAPSPQPRSGRLRFPCSATFAEASTALSSFVIGLPARPAQRVNASIQPFVGEAHVHPGGGNNLHHALFQGIVAGDLQPAAEPILCLAQSGHQRVILRTLKVDAVFDR
jgi:hypothetical protein